MISSPEQLIDLLNKLPKNIRDQEQIYTESKAKVEFAKLDLGVSRAKAILEATGNATEKNAYAVKETVDNAESLIHAQKEADLEQAQLMAWEM